jgi:hypothetical protein
MNSLVIEQAKSKDDLKSFMELPWRLYKDDKYWIPPLRIEIKSRARRGLSGNKAALFLARREREVVGRISASISAPDSNEGNFGFYEAIDDIGVASALVEKALEWLKSKGVSKVIGPYNFLLEDPYPGFLADSYDRPPYFMMAYSKPYYIDQMNALGFEKAMDLYAYEVNDKTVFPQVFLDKARHAEAIPGIRLRNINLKNLEHETEIIRSIFNEALKNNWGYLSFSKEYARKMASDLKFLADPRIIFIAEVNGKPVGAVINLPNYNELFADCNGRLFPRGMLKLLFKKRSIKGLRAYAMGILPEYQRSGLGCLFIRESFTAGVKAGYEHAEITWILQSNTAMDSLTQFMGGLSRKTYRIFKKHG